LFKKKLLHWFITGLLSDGLFLPTLEHDRGQERRD